MLHFWHNLLKRCFVPFWKVRHVGYEQQLPSTSKWQSLLFVDISDTRVWARLRARDCVVLALTRCETCQQETGPIHSIDSSIAWRSYVCPSAAGACRITWPVSLLQIWDLLAGSQYFWHVKDFLRKRIIFPRVLERVEIGEKNNKLCRRELAHLLKVKPTSWAFRSFRSHFIAATWANQGYTLTRIRRDTLFIWFL